MSTPIAAPRSRFDLDQLGISSAVSQWPRAQHHRRDSNKGALMKRIALLALAAGLGWSITARAQDVGAAEALMKKSGCLKCHSVSAKKEGPPFKETAAKYKGKPDAAAALFKHLTSNPKIKVDGKEELHDSLKT